MAQKAKKEKKSKYLRKRNINEEILLKKINTSYILPLYLRSFLQKKTWCFSFSYITVSHLDVSNKELAASRDLQNYAERDRAAFLFLKTRQRIISQQQILCKCSARVESRRSLKLNSKVKFEGSNTYLCLSPSLCTRCFLFNFKMICKFRPLPFLLPSAFRTHINAHIFSIFPLLPSTELLAETKPWKKYQNCKVFPRYISSDVRTRRKTHRTYGICQEMWRKRGEIL